MRDQSRTGRWYRWVLTTSLVSILSLAPHLILADEPKPPASPLPSPGEVELLPIETIEDNPSAPSGPSPGIPVPTAAISEKLEAPAEPAAKTEASVTEQLQTRVAELERLIKEPKKESEKEKPKEGADKKKDEKDEKKIVVGWTDISTEKWNVKLGGHVQLDYINWASAPKQIPAQDYFEFRRLRLTADGAGYGILDFRLQMTLEPESVGETANITSPDVKDAYLSVNEIPILGRVRVGNFFVPFGLEQVTNDTMNIFLERSIPTQGVFTADREVGIACYNATENQRLTTSYGIFLDSISEGLKERIDDNQGYRLSGRLTWLPYYDEPSNGRYLVHTGVGVLYTQDQDQRVRFRARPQIKEGPRLIDSGFLNADSYTTGNLEAAIVCGRVTLQSEAFLSNVDLLSGGSTLVNGMYAHLSYFLTGESRTYERFGQHGAQFGRNQPFTNFFFVKGAHGWGAWELKARWSRLDLHTVDSGQYNDMTFGLNWYWNDRTRIMFDWIHPLTTRDTVFGTTESDILAMRFDWNW